MTEPDDGRLERWLARILGGGAALSAALLAAGLLLELVGGHRGASAALANAGLVILMATPILRVAASVGEYLLERDWLFAGLTGMVLATLLASLLVAFR
jgi:uncharacterized membrane protein